MHQRWAALAGVKGMRPGWRHAPHSPCSHEKWASLPVSLGRIQLRKVSLEYRYGRFLIIRIKLIRESQIYENTVTVGFIRIKLIRESQIFHGSPPPPPPPTPPKQPPHKPPSNQPP